MATADRVLSVLGLFTIERPEWTVEAIATELRLSSSTAYQYVGSLAQADLLVADTGGNYMIGPAVIALDRVTRRFDPLIHAAGESLRVLTRSVNGEAIGLLCRVYRLKVMCVDQEVSRPTGLETSYERGRLMPLTRGAASKIILANMPLRPLRRLYDGDPQAVAAAGLGETWAGFRQTLRTLARPGVMVTEGEIDPGVLGVAAPIFRPDGQVIGSISLVVEQQAFARHTNDLDRMLGAVRNAGHAISQALRR